MGRFCPPLYQSEPDPWVWPTLPTESLFFVINYKVLSFPISWTLVSTNQPILYMVPWWQFWPKNEVCHISFEGVPAQYYPIYFTIESMILCFTTPLNLWIPFLFHLMYKQVYISYLKGVYLALRCRKILGLRDGATRFSDFFAKVCFHPWYGPP